VRRGKRALQAVALALVAGAVGATISWAAIPDANGRITACYNPKKNGALRVVDAEAGKSCKASEVEISWNQQGPPAPPSSGPQEIDYAENAHDVDVTGTTPQTSQLLVAGNARSYDGSRIFLDFQTASITADSEHHVFFLVYRDSKLVGEFAHYVFLAGTEEGYNFEFSEVPPAGTHTYSVRALVGSGDVIVRGAPDASDGNSFSPMHLRVSL
jgi:hypothetical protein